MSDTYDPDERFKLDEAEEVLGHILAGGGTDEGDWEPEPEDEAELE